MKHSGLLIVRFAFVEACQSIDVRDPSSSYFFKQTPESTGSQGNTGGKQNAKAESSVPQTPKRNLVDDNIQHYKNIHHFITTYIITLQEKHITRTYITSEKHT